MQREQRLRRADDFAAVYRRGRSWANELLVLKAIPRSEELSPKRVAAGDNRYGFAVGKRVGKAVLRNRIRRCLREIVRKLPASPGWDTVLVARGPAAGASFVQLQRAVEDVFRRARLIGPSAQRASPPRVER